VNDDAPRIAGLRVGILGAGLMGAGIAEVFAAAGAEVAVHDPDPERVGELDGLERVRGVDSLAAAAAGADLVIEAAPEDLALKRELFAHLDAAAPAAAILATNSSAISTGEIAVATTRPERVVGTHWWNPPGLVDLVEVIEAEATSKETVARTIAILRAVGKTPVHVRRDLPGFVGNRLQHALRREALSLVDAGVCSPADADRVARQVLAPRLAAFGLIELADNEGLDRVAAMQEALTPHLERSGTPARGLTTRVALGTLGAKSGRGYFTWDETRRASVQSRLAAALDVDGPKTQGGLEFSAHQQEKTPPPDAGRTAGRLSAATRQSAAEAEQ
jgi:3-hydroxybutyryl-CoA dehydrogenase